MESKFKTKLITLKRKVQVGVVFQTNNNKKQGPTENPSLSETPHSDVYTADPLNYINCKAAFISITETLKLYKPRLH